MRHQCKVTVLDKKCFPDLQERYLADPASGLCPCFEVGQEFLFSREDGKDDFWHFGRELDRPSRAPKRGTASAATSTRRCRAAPSCTAGPTTSA